MDQQSHVAIAIGAVEATQIIMRSAMRRAYGAALAGNDGSRMIKVARETVLAGRSMMDHLGLEWSEEVARAAGGCALIHVVSQDIECLPRVAYEDMHAAFDAALGAKLPAGYVPNPAGGVLFV